MKTAVKWAALAVVAYVLWRLVQSRQATPGASSTAGGVSTGVSTGVAGAGAGVVSGAGPGSATNKGPAPLLDPSGLPPPTDTVDVAHDVSGYYSDPIELGVDCLADDLHLNHGRISNDIMTPASRVRLFADIPRVYWSTMFGLLGGTLDRQVTRSRRWQQLDAMMADQATGAVIDQVIGTVVSTIVGIVGGPVVAALIKFAVSSQVQQLGTAIAQEGAIVDFVSRLRQNANPAKFPTSILMILDGNVDDKSSRDPTGSTAKLGAALNMPPDVVEAVGLESPFFYSLPPTSANYIPAWFYLTRAGLLLPWVSRELIGATYGATCNMRARVLRAGDALACMVKPMAPTPNIGRYWYRNKVLGDIMGSRFPPTEEDTFYIDDKGQRYSYDGRAAMSITQIETSAITLSAPRTLANQAAQLNVAGVVPTGADASTGTGEVFNLPGSPEDLAAKAKAAADAAARVAAAARTAIVLPPAPPPPPSTTIAISHRAFGALLGGG